MFESIIAITLIAFPALCVAAEKEQADPFDLGQIVVTGTKTPHLMEDTPVRTRVISREQIEKSGVTKAADLLRSLPGVNISGGAPGAVSSRSTALMRGLPAQYSLILLDGRRFKPEHIHTGVNLILIPIEMIERIEIVEGPASALYGSDAMGGVINIVTSPVERPAGRVPQAHRR